MTKIKTAKAWSRYDTIGGLIVATTDRSRDFMYDSCVIVHGLTESEVHEAAALRSACRELGIETVEQLNVIVRMACELRNMTAIHDYEEQVYQKIVPEIRAEYE